MPRRGFLRKSEKITAETARRITGISTPFGGVQWADPGPSEREHVRRFILFLEDRRVLYNPDYLEVRSQVDHSIHEIRRECTDALRQAGENAFAAVPIRSIREACRTFHDESNLQFRHIDAAYRHGESAGFFVALGGFRAVVGQQVALLAAHYDLDIDGDLASVLPSLEE
jgi:hypothetical protein